MKTVCIDAGHYGKYNQSPAIPEYFEAQMAWKLHNYLAEELEKLGVKTIKTRTEQGRDLGRQKRGNCAKGCDLFISIHSNAVGGYVNEKVDYPLAYTTMDGKCDSLGATLVAIIKSVMGTTQEGSVKHRVGNTGKEYYGVLLGCSNVGVPGIILEHSFHTNTKSTKWLMNDNNLRRMAVDEAKAICNWLGVDMDNPYDYAVNMYEMCVGSRGCNVKAVQGLLNLYGFNCGLADGIFGEKTKNAVIEYQRSKNLADDGIVGVKTMTALCGYEN